MKTFFAKESDIERRWFLVDAADQVLGRMAVPIATILMGKHRPIYTPNLDTGEFVVVINAEKIRLTGNKMETKTYKRWSGYPGGLRYVPISTVMEKYPEQVIREAVRRMLPKGILGKRMLSKLKIYAGGEHPHVAQKVEPIELKTK